MRWICSLLIITATSGPLATAQSPAKLTWYDLTIAKYSTVQWSVDPTTHKLNFRRCDWNDEGRLKCLPPMLSRGISPTDFSTLLRYYNESVQNSGGHKFNQIVGILTASLVGVGAYLSMAGVVMGIIPEPIGAVLKGSYHVLTIGGILALLGYAGTIEIRRHRQSLICKRLGVAISQAQNEPPIIYLPSQDVFNEFAKTFHKSLWEFTHGAPYSPDVMILQ